MPLKESDKYFKLCAAVFACSTLAYERKDMTAFYKAKDLHRKYRHKHAQAIAKEIRQRG